MLIRYAAYAMSPLCRFFIDAVIDDYCLRHFSFSPYASFSLAFRFATITLLRATP